MSYHHRNYREDQSILCFHGLVVALSINRIIIKKLPVYSATKETFVSYMDFRTNSDYFIMHN